MVVDPDGEIALLTSGAGLSMMLIDEMRGAGLKPYKFLDIRTGGLRGETRHLVNVLNWMRVGKQVKMLMIFFAGALTYGSHGGYVVKRAVLETAGVAVYDTLNAMVEGVATRLL